MIHKGYKATDQNMCCKGHQFELGKWYEVEGDLKMCKNGFHFCEYPSGPWRYYQNCRIFEVEAKEVLLGTGSGAGLKHVARKIRLVKEILFAGNGNTGDGNTGYKNTGDKNTGNGNTGNKNTGDGNTGDGNVGVQHSGCLCDGEAPFFLFNKKADRSNADFYLINRLSILLARNDPIDPTPFLAIQNATEKAIKRLHKLHIKARKQLV